MPCAARRVRRRARVVALVAVLQVVDDQRRGVLVVRTDADSVVFGRREALPVLVPVERDRQVALQDLKTLNYHSMKSFCSVISALLYLTRHGRSHALVEQTVREEEGHDGGRRCKRERKNNAFCLSDGRPSGLLASPKAISLTRDLNVDVAGVGLVPPVERGARVVSLVRRLGRAHDGQGAVRKHFLASVARQLVPV